MAKAQKTIKEQPLKLNMTFEKAMSKALSTSLPKQKETKKSHPRNNNEKNH